MSKNSWINNVYIYVVSPQDFNFYFTIFTLQFLFLFFKYFLFSCLCVFHCTLFQLHLGLYCVKIWDILNFFCFVFLHLCLFFRLAYVCHHLGLPFLRFTITLILFSNLCDLVCKTTIITPTNQSQSYCYGFCQLISKLLPLPFVQVPFV